MVWPTWSWAPCSKAAGVFRRLCGLHHGHEKLSGQLLPRAHLHHCSAAGRAGRHARRPRTDTADDRRTGSPGRNGSIPPVMAPANGIRHRPPPPLRSSPIIVGSGTGYPGAFPNPGRKRASWPPPSAPPTVPEGQSRIRLALSSLHTWEQITDLRRVAKSQSRKVAKSQSRKVAESQSGKVAESQR